jgi:LPS-assembly protein
MKNKYKIYLFIIFSYLSCFSTLLANDFNFNTSEIKITDNGNIINATNGEANSLDGNIKIIADKFNYNKNKLIINANSNATALFIPKNIEIKADNIEYNENTLTFNATGNVNLKDLTNNTLIKSQSIYFNTKNQTIGSDIETSIEDNSGNFILTQSFFFNQKNNLIKINDAKLNDIEKNTYYLSNGFVDLNQNKFLGKDISIDFNNKFFDENNEPRLKGNAVSSDGNKTVVSKGVFTTCKKNDTCPPWQMSADKITHDKQKQTIYYDKAWLKIYDKPILYFPKFFHPDPTVKRQSGFLMPSLGSSTNFGSFLNIPYYQVLSENRDLTFRPRLYTDEKILLQSEYRQLNENSEHLIDVSYLSDSNPTKNHFFSKSNANLKIQNFDETQVKLNIQHVSNETYLKAYKIKSPIIDNTDVMSSSLEFDTYREDLSFNTSLHVFEDLGARSNDRYEFVYPNYMLSKKIESSIEQNGQLELNSNGFIKNYNTNVFEKVIINDLQFNSYPHISNNGLKNNFNFLIKNVNTEASKSKEYREDRRHSLATLLQYNLSYPLSKKTENYTNKFKPLLAIKYSPNKTKYMGNTDRRLDMNNVYSLNRIGSNDNIEEGESLTYGFDYVKTNNSSEDVFEASLANVLRVDESKNLPNQSGLANKTSDVIGKLNYNPNKILKLGYDVSLDSNLDDINYQLINTEFKINNFVTSFEFLNENKSENNSNYITNKTSYSIMDESMNLAYETRIDKKTGLTEFYNLIYQYRNDCLTAAIEYNKDFYNDGELKSEENVFFKLTIIPFAETRTTNLLQ